MEGEVKCLCGVVEKGCLCGVVESGCLCVLEVVEKRFCVLDIHGRRGEQEHSDLLNTKKKKPPPKKLMRECSFCKSVERIESSMFGCAYLPYDGEVGSLGDEEG